MKLKFDSKLPYQQQAISAVVDLFRGQPIKQSGFSIDNLGLYGGVGNSLVLHPEEILSNLQAVQLRNGLPQSSILNKPYDFDVEMETGTGKTYVYLRTIFELNKKYGFSKFIIVVPSIAIKEGVNASIRGMREHFRELYDNTIFDSFIYDSEKLGQVRNFAVSDNIQIMIINIDAFRRSFDDTDEQGNLKQDISKKDLEKKLNIIHRERDQITGLRPIDMIRETNPFVIIDEPQSVDSTEKSTKAINSLNPLCILRYSATHVKKHHLVYKLDAVDAFDMQLVKQIEVDSFGVVDYHNQAYLRLVSVDNKPPITAKLELDCDKGGKVSRKVFTIKKGDDLSDKKLGNRAIYEGYIVQDIYCEPGNEYVDFTSKTDVLHLNKPIGHIDERVIKEQQIRRTIEAHLNKELSLNPLGINVLSLFFIDRVANYRTYDADKNPQKGIYAELFEKHYQELIKKPKYNSLFKEIDMNTPVEKVHDGYFAIDKGVAKDTKGNTAADDTAYEKIMRKKEELLSKGNKLRFIFSHSALREGWDNPNVFQICTLNETRSEVKRRQEIGRGLRICVDHTGERVHGFSINTLTVMANESYEDFAKGLQQEYEEDQGIKFGLIERHSFANITLLSVSGECEYLGVDASANLFEHFVACEYIDNSGKVQDKLRTALSTGSLDIPQEYKNAKGAIVEVAKKTAGNLNIRPAKERKKVEINKQVFLSPEFKMLWDKIKYKTTYAVEFDTDKLIKECSEDIFINLEVQKTKGIWTTAGVNIDKGGVHAIETDRQAVTFENYKENLPDIVTFLQNETNLTRRTIVQILVQSKRLDLFEQNPQRYMEEVLKIITAKMRLMLIDGIKYTKIGAEDYYAQELFETQELFGYLTQNMIPSQRSIFDHVVFDSSVEELFAQRFENNKSIKCYAKLPDWFKINTPLGTYNPDWAVLVARDDEEKLYFVLETKKDILAENLRLKEISKIKCGHKHFEALGHHIEFKAVDRYETWIESI